MKNLYFLVLLFMISFSSCNVLRKSATQSLSKMNLNALPNGDIITVIEKNKNEKKTYVESNISLGKKVKIWNNDEVLIKDKKQLKREMNDFKLSIEVSKDKFPSDNSYSPCIKDETKYTILYDQSSSSYSFTGKKLNDIIREDGAIPIANGNWLNIKLYDISNKPIYNSNFQYNKVISWGTKISTPVLYIAQGGLSEFSVQRFSPSIGFTIAQANFNTTTKFKYIGINGLFDIQSFDIIDSNNQTITKYSLGFGVTAEFAGYIQIGPVYNFKDKSWNLAFGMTSELIQKLFGLDK